MYIVFWIFSAAAFLLLAGFAYQSIGSHRDRLRYAGLGRWVTIDQGYKLYLLEQGAGGPTVLFEAGIGATNLNWRHIQETVSRFTGTASYDRGGLGWSSRCRTARTPVNIAQELHDLLEHAEIKPPYILVGHSFGGLVIDAMRCSIRKTWPGLCWWIRCAAKSGRRWTQASSRKSIWASD